MQTNSPALKIGLIVDSEIAPKYIFELAEWGQSQPNLKISHLIIQNVVPNKPSRLAAIKKGDFFKLLARATFNKLLVKLEAAFLRRHRLFHDHLGSCDLSGVVANQIAIKPKISPSGFVYRYDDENVNAVRALNLDLLVRCGSGILRGEILNSSRLGIISFHHADNRSNRGVPPGFWEVYFKQSQTGFIIQRLTEELDGGEVLLRGSFATQPSYLVNQAFLYAKSNFYMKHLIQKIAEKGELPEPEESRPYFDVLFKTPSLVNQFTYGMRLIRKKLSSLARTILKREDRWNIAYSRVNWKNLVMWRANRIENPPHCYLADPFVITEGGRDFCFAEEYDLETKRGCIVVYELETTTAKRLGSAISEPFHMSFPYLFRFNDKLYMCPETSEKRDIRLYECVDFPLHWKFCTTLMDDVSAADTMIFEKDGRWWMFTNIDPTSVSDYSSELFIFHSDNPLSKNWTPHTKNPIFTDPNKARNAGLLHDGGSVYRVAQKQGYDFYGESFSINRITSLTQEMYSEDLFCAVEPRFFKNIMGTHHLHSNGNVTVFDYVQSE